MIAAELNMNTGKRQTYALVMLSIRRLGVIFVTSPTRHGFSQTSTYGANLAMVETASEDESTLTKTPPPKRQIDPVTVAREAKRRRLGIAANTLSKPFRSPLLSTRKPTSTPTPISSGSPPSPTEATPCKPRKPFPAARNRPIASAKQPADPELAALYKKQSALESTLRSKKASLETVLQALKIETAGPEDSDEKLEELIEKWRGAARGAADVLFEFASERVNNMGSSGGWKEMIRPKNPWDDEKPQVERKERVEEDDDDFTMEVMLKTLHIDLNLIGYDRGRECWN